jgi:NTE family protein
VDQTATEGIVPVSIEENRNLVKRYDDEILNRRNYDALPGLVTDDLVDPFAPPGAPGGPEAARQALEMMVGGIPDMKVESQDIIVEGDLVGFRSTLTGTHEGFLFGMPPTHGPLNIESVQLWRVENGKLAERWVRSDMSGFGPPPGAGAPSETPPQWGNQPAPQPHPRDPAPDPEANKALVVEYCAEVINKHDRLALPTYLSADAIDHSAPPGFPQGVDGAAMMFGMYWGAFSTIRYQVDDMIAEGDRVVVRATLTGTHDGPFMGLPATGKAISVGLLEMLRCADGKIVEHWGGIQDLSLFQQLGIVPGAMPAQQSG